MPQPTAPAPPAARAVYPAYVVGLFSMGMMDLFVILVPLYAISLGLSATQIGILVGVRGVLTMLFAIHAGTLMDRFGIAATARASMSFYNTRDEVDSLVKGIDRVIEVFS